MNEYHNKLYTLRWFVTSVWTRTKMQGEAIKLVSDALPLAPDQGDIAYLYTLRWYFTNHWGDPRVQIDLIDIVTELLDEEVTHIDHDMIPDKSAEVTEEEEELTYSQPELKKPQIKSGIKVGLAIGHNKYTGASSYEGDDEFTTRKAVTLVAQEYLAEAGVESKIFIRNRAKSYGSAMREHGSKMKAYGSKINIEMHFNAAGPTATGTEIITVSKASSDFYKPLCKHFAGELGIPLRGDGGARLRPSGRGSGFGRNTPGRSGIWEPCFSSNKSDWELVDEQFDKEGKLFAEGLLISIEESLR